MFTLSANFPGDFRQTIDYSYYLTGDLFQATKISFQPLFRQLEETGIAFGQFSEKIKKLPDKEALITGYSRREAVTSSRIEGTQATIGEAFMSEQQIPYAEKRDEWQEVQRYIQALNHAAAQIKSGLPLSNRLIKSTHRILLNQPRGVSKNPGEFRASQNWIGGSRPGNAHFVPPAPQHVADAMSNLEKFIHDESTLPHLIKIALIHYQFETIHPFLDGNGRVGRILIPLYLQQHGILELPVLYISGYFEENRSSYYDMLNNGRKSAEGVIKWVSFFLDAVHQTADSGIRLTDAIIALKARLEEKLEESGKHRKNRRRLLDYVFHQPVLSAASLQEKMQCKTNEAHALIKYFQALGILTQINSGARNRLFIFDEYVRLLETEIA